MATKEKESKALPEGQAESPKKTSKVKRIVIILAILLITLSGAGIGAYWWFFMRTPSSAASASATPAATDAAGKGAAGHAGAGAGGANGGASGHAGAGGAGGAAGAGGSGGAGDGRIERQGDLPRSGGQVLPLPAITVNISDPSGRRYLKLGMEVEVNADVGAALQANSPRIRDAIIMLLAGKTFNDISTPDGKVLLKAEVAARLNQILGAQRVIRVYFTDFVVE